MARPVGVASRPFIIFAHVEQQCAGRLAAARLADVDMFQLGLDGTLAAEPKHGGCF
jgi:hypothetical protein